MQQVGRHQPWERQAVAARDVLARSVEHLKSQALLIESPYLGDPKGVVDTHAIERTAGNVDLDGQVWRGIRPQIELTTAAHSRLVGDPPGPVRLQPAPPAPSSQGSCPR